MAQTRKIPVPPPPPDTPRAFLAELVIENLAVVERVHLTLAPGFVVLSGETGVGKSILVDALRLLGGERASATLIRKGAPRAVVEGVCRGVPAEVSRLLTESGVMADGAEELLLRRVLSPDGNHAAFINDRRVGSGLLAEVGALLFDIHAQHAHQSLMVEAGHGPLLDAAGGLVETAARYRDGYAELRQLDTALAEAEVVRRDAARRVDVLTYEINEIKSVAPEAGEDDALAEELARLSNAEQLRQMSAQAFDTLYGGEGAVLETLSGVSGWVDELARVDSGQKETLGLVADARLLLESAADNLRQFRDGIRSDPEREAEVDARLGRIEALKRKYGRTVGEILETARSFERELAELQGMDDRTAALSARRAGLLSTLEKRAEALHEGRITAARTLCAAAEQALARLSMPHARLSVALVPYDDGIAAGRWVLGANGAERVRFLFSANPGEDPKPLAKVGSGGELSRVMLAIKSVLVGVDPVPCLVFDEVDAGIGGAVAQQVGNMLKGLSGQHQVLCVTHLPQIASLAEQHLVVSKETDGARTRTAVVSLDGAGRVAEVARMLAGERVTATTLEHAREMLTAG